MPQLHLLSRRQPRYAGAYRDLMAVPETLYVDEYSKRQLAGIAR